MTPFRIILTLQTPAAIHAEMTLDGLLGGAIWRLTEDAEAAINDIPLQRTDGVWHGSRVEFLEGEFTSLPAIAKLSHKDFPAENYSGAENTRGNIRINVAGGDYAPQLRQRRTFAGQVAFYGCGDIERVQSLLESLPGIGKNVRQGLGRIAEIEIEPTDQDQSLVLNGEPMRPIPVAVWEAWGHASESCLSDHVTWTSPYWAQEQKQLCVLPA